MEAWILGVLHALALPRFGLSTVFVVALLSATLLPMGSEPAVFGLVKLNESLFWPAVLVATAGNTIGGMISWWMGHGAHTAVDRLRSHNGTDPAGGSSPGSSYGSRAEAKALQWLRRFGPKACLLSWLPVVGDPLCAVAGWMRLPLWPCTVYMAIGKFLRYTTMTALLLWVFPQELNL